MSKLAVFFPGIGYTVDKPLLHYSRRIVQEFGYEIQLLTYDGFPQGVNHSLESADLQKDIINMQKIMRETSSFIMA